MTLIDQPIIFVIGSPRGGTTWLQALLGSHPEIVTGQESHLFWRYVLPLHEGWQWSLATMSQDKRYIGLASYLTQEEFDEWVRNFVYTVLSKLEGAKPGARFILEKTPAHTLYLDLISYYLPTARFIHIIRDGRDVVASLMAAGKSWGHRWAPANAGAAARQWKTHTLAGLRGQAFGERYTEVRYESLLANGVQELSRLFKFLQIACSPDQIAQILESQSFERQKRTGLESEAIIRRGEVLQRGDVRLREPDGFYRRGGTRDWRTELTFLDRQFVYHEAGDLLVELEYESADVLRRETRAFRAVHGCYRMVRPILRWSRLERPFKRVVLGHG